MTMMKLVSCVSNAVKSGQLIKTVRNRVERHYCTRVGPAIHLNKSEVLVDEKVHMTVTGLRNQQKVTVLSSFNESEKTFASCGHYIADEQGGVDLACQSSLGGTFSGIQSMGLITSTRELNGKSWPVKNDVMTPYDVTLSVHDGHVDCDRLAQDFVNSGKEPLAMTSLKRGYKAQGVRKINIQQPEWLDGSLFLPPGDGPHPGIIEVPGQLNNVTHHRAALLASHGYAVFALNHTFFEDVPDSVKSVDYFLDACDWFAEHPMISPGGVGMITFSTGGCISHWMAMHNDNIKALVSINGIPVLLPGFGFNFNGTTVKDIKIERLKYNFTDEGLEMRNSLDGINFQDYVIPIWEKNVKALYINGEEDMCMSPKWNRRLEEMIPHNKKENFQFLYYPGTGHLIEPPYSPLCTAQYHAFYKTVLLFGGETESHMRAQELAWFEILAFLKKYFMPF